MAHDFESIEIRSEREVDAAWTVRGDDVTAVAYWSALPSASAPSASRVARNLIAGAKLWPRQHLPIAFDDEASFIAWLSQRLHCGALAVLDPTLELDRDGKPVAVQLRRLARRWGRGFGPEGGRPVAPLDGKGVEVTFAPTGARIHHYQRFALPSPLDADGRWTPDAMVPFGWLGVTIDLCADGRSEVHVASSFLPSARFYREGQLCCRHEMSRCRPRELDAMLTPTPEVPTGTTWRRFAATGYVHALR